MCLWYELTATLRQKKVASKLNFTEIPYKSIVALRNSAQQKANHKNKLPNKQFVYESVYLYEFSLFFAK